MTQRESSIEAACRRYAAARGCWLLKLRNVVGIPDRILIMPGRKVAFVELKRPGETPTPIQLYQLRRLKEMGQYATWVDSVEAFKRYVDGLLSIKV